MIPMDPQLDIDTTVIDEVLDDYYNRTETSAIDETRYEEEVFPEDCTSSFDKDMNEAFLLESI